MSTKLYTEEQVRKAINDGSLYSYINGYFKFKNSEDDIIKAITPIELPTDEEIEKEAEKEESNSKQCAYWRGAKMVINKIQGGNNEPK